MINQEQKNIIESVLNTAIAGTDLFVVAAKFLPYDKVEIFLDADSSVTIQQCTNVARAINKQLEEKFPDLIYELEVSSAGLEHSLQSLRQYKKNIGRNLEVHLNDGKLIEGKLIAADEAAFVLEYQLPKAKHKKEQKTFAYTDAKEVFVGVSFK